MRLAEPVFPGRYSGSGLHRSTPYAAAQDESSNSRAIVQVAVIPVIQSRADNDSAAAARLFRGARKFARKLDDWCCGQRRCTVPAMPACRDSPHPSNPCGYSPARPRATPNCAINRSKTVVTVTGPSTVSIRLTGTPRWNVAPTSGLSKAHQHLAIALFQQCEQRIDL